MPKEKLSNALLAKATEGTKDVLESFGTLGTTLAKKLVGIADDLFLYCFWAIVTWRKGQMSLFDLRLCKACTSMAFCHTSVTKQPLLAQHLTAQIAV